jgi:hypothetical protein
VRFDQIEWLESRTLLSVSSHARIVNGDIVDGIINGNPTAEYDAVGLVGNRTGWFCTGTLIAPQFVLTAGHCAEGIRATHGRFAIDGSTYATSQVYVHPDYNGNRIGFSDNANDIAIFQLSVSVAGVEPDAIFRGTPHVGDVVTLVGFGAGGTGSSGHDGSFGTKRAGTTPIDGVTPRRILWTFDNNQESNTAPGDSGGPAYITMGGVNYVAGVTSGGDRYDAGIGDHSYDTRVDYYASWIDSIVGISEPLDSGPAPGPQPSGDDHADVPGSDATALGIGSTFATTGSLETRGDRDVFRVEVSERGSLSLDLSDLTGSLDTYLRVFDADGNLVAGDDDSGPGRNSHLSLLVQSGVYYVSAGAYNDAGTGNYQLSGRFATDDHADTLIGATSLPIDASGSGFVGGSIGQSGDRDVFRFVAGRNGHLAIDLEGLSGFDPVLTVFDSRGRVVAANDDWFGGTRDSHVVVRVRSGSAYYVQAAGYLTSQGEYSLQLSPTVAARHGGGIRSAAAVFAFLHVENSAVHADDVDDVDDAAERSRSVSIERSVNSVAESTCAEPSIASQAAAPHEHTAGGSTSAHVIDHILADAIGDAVDLG